MGRVDGDGSEVGVSAADVADLLLAILVGRRATALILQPEGAGHLAAIERGAGARAAVAIPSALGDAVAVRLGAIGGIELDDIEERVGHARVRVGAEEASFLVVVQPTPRGLSAELRRVAERQVGLAPTMPAEVVRRPPGRAAGASTGDDYLIESEIGRGGMGVVYRARHRVHGRPVALKMLHADLAADPAVAARFVREGMAASLAQAPNIVEITDFGTSADGRAFLVMELVAGQTLEAHLKAGALEPRRALKIARQICAALEAAHVRGVVHRDLKPANVFVDGQDRVKVGDFGAAKILELTLPDPSVTLQGMVVGTPLYMSPEHARGLPTDGRTDLYALGCVLFQMLTGAVPFDGTTMPAVLLKHIADPVPEIVSPFGPLPDAVTRVVVRAMAKDPEQRPRSATEMLADIDRAVVALRGTRGIG